VARVEGCLAGGHLHLVRPLDGIAGRRSQFPGELRRAVVDRDRVGEEVDAQLADREPARGGWRAGDDRQGGRSRGRGCRDDGGQYGSGCGGRDERPHQLALT
jgi:hypothetical protein